ncbi:HAMP domain-containing protein [Brevibacillus sp. GCM10020057]|uniref:HAMP domain-containing protein n=1 Tax=Brevibacillus sp. GCM10020057 TaxID=3317327 RepID=UPI0036374ABE
MNRKQHKSLLQQFLSRIFFVLIIISVITGVVQLYLINQQITLETDNQAFMIAESINKGIEETLLASSAIEHQIDLKLISYAERIADRLQNKNLQMITNEELIATRDEMGVAGITILAKTEGDIVGVLSTEPQDIGFSLKKVGFLEAADNLLNGRKVSVPGATFLENNMVVLPIAQSESHVDQPAFYKYSYYHPPGKPYIINVFIEAGEVYQFTREIGPDVWISKVRKENSNVKEIGILTPKVFADPSLEQKLYPPLKKIVHGTFNYESDEDIRLLTQLSVQPKVVTSIQSIDKKKIYKMFLPIKDDKVVYIALDFDEIRSPLVRHSVILIVSGFVSLVALFALTARFFAKIYKDIQKIIAQMKQLETGDLTARSDVTAKGELGDLSHSVNKMTYALRRLLTDTHKKAIQAQRVAVVLEAEANHSVEKAFSLSMEKTATARDSIDEIFFCLDQVEELLEQQKENSKATEILDKINRIRDWAKERTNNTTEITITLADLLKSLHAQSSELSDIANVLLQKMERFKL